MTEFDVEPPIIIVMGGQFGSEGKGEITAALAKQVNEELHVVRTGGPNAGHTVTGSFFGNPYRVKMRHVPAAWVRPDAHLYLSAGGLVDPHVLVEEMAELRAIGWDGDFNIDPMAMVITDKHRQFEVDNGMRGRIGSTTEGIGAARVDKLMRTASLIHHTIADRWEGVDYAPHVTGKPPRDGTIWWNIDRWYDDPAFGFRDVAGILNPVLEMTSQQVEPDAHIIIESTQGFGLSLEASGFYPYTTSANITPGHLLGECGISSKWDHFVLSVMRTYPIRVAGNSGPLHDETTWERLHQASNGRAPLDGERTTVTKLVRRIGGWDRGLAGRMAQVCRPDGIALTFLDYVFPDLADVTDAERIVEFPGVRDYLSMIEQDCSAPIVMVSTGPGKVAMLWN